MGFVDVQNKPVDWTHNLAQISGKEHSKSERPWKTDHQKILQVEDSYHGALAENDRPSMLENTPPQGIHVISSQRHAQKSVG